MNKITRTIDTMFFTISLTRGLEALTFTSTAPKRLAAAEMAAHISAAYWPGAVTPSGRKSEKQSSRKHTSWPTEKTDANANCGFEIGQDSW